MSELVNNSPTSPSSPAEPEIDEKAVHPTDEKESPFDADDGCSDEDGRSLYVNGEPVITSGKDVSKYLVDLRDDGDPPVTFRSLVLGTVIGGLGAALYQVRTSNTEYPGNGPSNTACRSMFSSLSNRASQQCFYSSFFTHLALSGLLFSQSALG
jgi:hypothetical protein